MKRLRTSFPYSERSSLLPVSFWQRALATAAIPLLGTATLRAHSGEVETRTFGGDSPNFGVSYLDYSLGFASSTSDTRDGSWTFTDSFLFTVNLNGGLILGDPVNSDGGRVASGTLTQQGQSTLLIESNGILYLGGYGKGIYNLNGGTLKIGGSSLQAGYDNQLGRPGKFDPKSNGAPTGGYEFNLGGGTIETTSALTTSVKASLTAGTVSKINTSGGDATWNGNFEGFGTLLKTGTGTLKLSGSTSNFLGTFAAHQGSTVQTTGTTLSGVFYVGSRYPAPALSTANADFTLEGGALTIHSAAFTAAATAANQLSESQPTLLVGDAVDDIGVMTQKDWTTVNINGAGAAGAAPGANLTIGGYGGNGTYNLQGGDINLDKSSLILGNQSGATGLLTMTGGSVNATNGSILRTGAGTGTLTQTGGVITVEAGSAFALTGPAGGTYNLNSGGTLKIGGASLQAGDNLGKFNLSGGTLETTSALTTGVNANLTADTISKIDTGGGDAAWSGNFTGTGGLIKTGTGTLTLSGSGTRQFGGFDAHQGSTVQTAGDTVSSSFLVGSSYPGGGLSAAVGSFTLDGGSITVAKPLLFSDFDGSDLAAFVVGEFSGSTGVMTQKAGTTVNVTGTAGEVRDAYLAIGDFGGSGAYHLEGGDLNLSNSSLELGFGTGGSGLLTMTGGTLNLTNGARIRTLGGTGTITQTGGVISVDASSTFTPAGPAGATYNLNSGGLLWIGGTSLDAGDNLGKFNLGGGTIETRSALTTAVNATLVENTISTINTAAGKDAAWSGEFFGIGGLIKTGTGTLTLSGNGTRQFGGFDAHQGSTLQTAGNTIGSTFLVGSSYPGTGLSAADASFTLSSGTITVAKPLSFPAFGGVAEAAFVVGDNSGDTGVMTQKEGTAVYITGTAGGMRDAYLAIGAFGGKGTYHLEGGDINLSNSSLILGNNTGAEGLLTMTGGSVNLTNGAILFTGAGTGTLTQSGGDIDVDASSRFIPAGRAGATYNLNSGGRLRIGGDSLQAGDSGGDINEGHFNLGGGNIETSSPMTTGVNVNLVADTVSEFHTPAGNAAVWSGNLSGGGGLSKTGPDSLTLSGNLTYTGTTSVNDTGSTLRLKDNFESGNLATATGANHFVVVAGAALILEQNETTGTFGRQVQGAGQLRVLGSGDLTLTGSNTHTGGTVIGSPDTVGGTVTVDRPSPLGPLEGDVIVNKSTLNILGEGTYIPRSIRGTVSGGVIQANGMLLLGSADHQIDTRATIKADGFPVTLLGDDDYAVGGQSASVKVGGITLATGGGIYAPAGGINVVSDGFSGTPSAVISASGSAGIQGKVVAGDPAQPGNPAVGDYSGHVFINGPTGAGEKLSITGPLFGNYIVTGNTSLSAGSSAGFNSGLALVGTSSAPGNVEQDSPLIEVWGTARGTSPTGYDATDVVNGHLSYSGVITVTLYGGGYAPAAGDIFDLVRLSDSSSTFTASGASFDFSGAPLPGGLSWDSSDFFNNGNGDLSYTLAVVPETSVSALLLLSAAGLAARRRRRQA